MITGPGGDPAAGEELMITNAGLTTHISLDVGPDRVDMIVSTAGDSLVTKLTAHDADRWAAALAVAAEQAKLSGSAPNN